MACFFDNPIDNARQGFDDQDVLQFWIWKSQIDAGQIKGTFGSLALDTPWVNFQIVETEDHDNGG